MGHRIRMESSMPTQFLTMEELYYIIYCVLWTFERDHLWTSKWKGVQAK